MDICILLLEHYVDPFLKDSRGFTADKHAEMIHPEMNIHVMLRSFMNPGVGDVEMT